MRTFRRFGPLILTALLSGCSTAGSTPQSAASSHRHDGLSGAEIFRSGGATALDGVRLLRLGRLTGRAPVSLRSGRRALPVAYLDGTRLGSLERLALIHHSEVESMRYLDGPTATQRYGTNHIGGAIVVTTRVGR